MRRCTLLNAALAATTLVAFATTSIAADLPPEPPKGAPPYQAPPGPTDGAQMALTIQKLEKPMDPPRPLLVWAIGSSFTNGLGNGDFLIKQIRQRFPDAPEIDYKKMAGDSTSYHFSHGWARHLVIPDQPDVVLIYNFGKAEDLEQLIAELRRNTTADILVGSLHWCNPHKRVWPDPDAANSHQDPQALRALAKTYGVEFVENRREMTRYMTANGLEIEDLLADSVHENRYASRMTVMNIARHFHRPDRFDYDPADRERRLEAESAAVKKGGDWQTVADGEALQSTNRASEVEVPFTGNRIDLIGWRCPDGGTAEVWIDGKPAEQFDAFYASYVQPDPKNAPNPPNPPRDRCPHAVTLGKNLVPQTWTITMTSDTCDYQLVGSVTGLDGSGNALKPFTGNSGQIIIQPEFWRDAKANRTDDRFTFDVVRTTMGKVDFKAPHKEKFRLRLAANLSNRAHVLRLVTQGNGAVSLDAFDIFEPPLKEAPEPTP